MQISLPSQSLQQTSDTKINQIAFEQDKKPKYIFKYPFRFVQPYNHIFQAYAKKRWIGKNIVSFLSSQFLAYSQQYFIEAIKTGKIRINGKAISTNYIIANSDFLQHETIRQQPPILDLPVQIIHEDDNLLVVNKPPSITVHTGGGYHYNTLLAILHYQMGYKNLYILHRLDRLTSGLVILAKSRHKTTKFHEESMGAMMKKCYFARVQGMVEFQERVVNAPLICRSFKEGVWAVYQAESMQELVKSQQPKQSSTKFTKIWYDEQTDSSLLQCFPITGRTHQIRVHLQYIGYPILNDVVYGGKFIGNHIIERIQYRKSEGDDDEEEVVDRVEKKIKGVNQGLDAEEQIMRKGQQLAVTKNWYDKWEYKERPLEIMLHSHRYIFEGKEYISRPPYWLEVNALKPEVPTKSKPPPGKVEDKSSEEVEMHGKQFMNKIEKEGDGVQVIKGNGFVEGEI